MRLLFPILAALSLSPATAPAQPPAAPASTAPASDARAVIAALATDLESRFLDPATGRAYAAAIRAKAASGAYDALAPADLARMVTADLQAVSSDRHLQLKAPRPAAPGPGRAAAGGPEILRSGWIAPGVAYISFAHFHGEPAAMAQLAAFLDTHRDARALIIDARQHHGGGADEMNAIFSAIYPKATELVWMDTRVAVDDGDSSGGTRPLPSPEGVVRRTHWATPAAHQGRIARAPVYYLTSHVTASAAEHMATALKRTGRGTLIGETTAGAGNYGSPVDLPGGYRAFIPYGRTYDPKTGKGWEAIGVAPDIAVPADQALDVALGKLGVRTSAADSLAAMPG